MKALYPWTVVLSSTLILISLNGCTGRKPDSIGNSNATLSPCSPRPNCVSSDALDIAHRVEPFQLVGNFPETWKKLQEVVMLIPRSTVAVVTEQYIHVECKSRIFRFVDDLELLLNPDTGLVSVRSASRLGYSDLGANRNRVNYLRNDLLNQGVISK